MVQIIISVSIGFAVGIIVLYILTMNRRRKRITFPKILVSAVVAHGMILTTMSYVLSFCNKEPVASVSEVIVKEILAPTVTYIIGNVVANIFEKNVTKFSTPIEVMDGKDDING